MKWNPIVFLWAMKDLNIKPGKVVFLMAWMQYMFLSTSQDSKDEYGAMVE
jgi:hypothetical protein